MLLRQKTAEQATGKTHFEKEKAIQSQDDAQIYSVLRFMMLDWAECFLRRALTRVAGGAKAVRCFVHLALVVNTLSLAINCR